MTYVVKILHHVEALLKHDAHLLLRGRQHDLPPFLRASEIPSAKTSPSAKKRTIRGPHSSSPTRLIVVPINRRRH